MRRPHDKKANEFQQAEMFGHLRAIVDYLKDTYPDIKKQSEMKAGLRSASLGIMGSGGVSDPTGNAVAEERPDVADWALDCLTEIDGFYALAKSVQNRVRRLMPPEASEEGEAGCRSCRRLPKNWSPIHRSERCRWCYDFWLVEKVDPPTELLIARQEGKRITDRMVRESLGRRSA